MSKSLMMSSPNNSALTKWNCITFQQVWELYIQYSKSLLTWYNNCYFYIILIIHWKRRVVHALKSVTDFVVWLINLLIIYFNVFDLEM